MKRFILFVLAFMCLGLTGCAQLTGSGGETKHYQFVKTEPYSDILPPPKLSDYQIGDVGSYYDDPRTPYIEDLRHYMDYIGRHLGRLVERVPFVMPLEASRCGMFILPKQSPLPRLVLTDINDVDTTLEETLIYAKALREHNTAYEKAVEKAYEVFLKTCKV